MTSRILDDQYEILHPLGAGHTSAVAYGWDIRQRRPVAIREIDPSAFDDPAKFEMFRRALLAGAGLHHPNIVDCYALRQGNAGRIYMVTEFVDGIDLETVLRRLSDRHKRLPLRIAQYVVEETLRALAYAHSSVDDCGQPKAPVFHHGICPHGIMLATNGTVKLKGFGLGLLPSPLSHRQHDTTPENARSDLFSVGVLLYELIVGQPPFGSGSEPGRSRRVLTGEYDRPALRRAKVPDAVVRIIDRALSAEGNQPYRDAAAMLADISLLAGSVERSQWPSLLSRTVVALFTNEESEKRRRLLIMRGGRGAASLRIATTALVPRQPGEGDNSNPANLVSVEQSAQASHAASTDPIEVDRVDAPGLACPRDRRLSGATHTLRKRLAWLFVLALLLYSVADYRLQFGPVHSLLRMARHENASPAAIGRVISVPPGARLLINGEDLGQTPVSPGRLPPGPLSLRLELPGYMPIDTVLMIPASGGLPALGPFVFRSQVLFSSTPSGARVTIDGKELSKLDLAHFLLTADDTVAVEYDLEGEVHLPKAYLCLQDGLVTPTDTSLWHWCPGREGHAGELVGTFFRRVRVHSQPPGANVYVDGDTACAGKTDLVLNLPYGKHLITLQKPPFVVYRFSVGVGRDTPDLFSPVLRRTVRLRAVDADEPGADLNAEIRWIREGTSYIKTPLDHLTTPYSLPLDAVDHEIRFSRKGFADTILIVEPAVDRVVVAMRRLLLDEHRRFADTDSEDRAEAWVRFRVRHRRKPIPGAEVIGVEKSSGVVVRYGITDGNGELFTRVPCGDYRWQAAKVGYEGRVNGERIAPRRGFKRITLQLTSLP